MLKLDDFFAPLGIINISIFFTFVICCEIIGFALAKTFIKKIPDFLRGAIWLLGLGLVVFLYFLSHFFVPFAFPAIGICLAILLIPSLPIYFKEKGWQSLVLCLKGVPFPIFLLLPAIPLIFIKASLPPYVWDEMAYHYISPYSIYYGKAWEFGSGVIENYPRLLETAYIALFSLTKTYATARLLHFSIFVTILLTVYKFLKDNLGRIPAILFFILVLYHGETFLISSTFGYVDVAAASFATLGIICLVSFFFKNNLEILSLSAAFWGMAVGAKYSSLTPFLVFLLICSVLLFRRKLFGKKYLKMYLVAILLFFIMGGYWYLKNFIHTGNPLFPFFTSFFGCRFSKCPSIELDVWTLPFSMNNARVIIDRIFASNKLFKILFFLSLPLSLFHPKAKVRKTSFFFSSIVLVEILIARMISGYEPRFFYRWQFLSILLIVLPITSLINYKNLIIKFYLVFTILLTIFTIYNSVFLITNLYTDERKPEREMEIQYALKKININQWIEQGFPKMKEVVFWCDHNSEAEELYVFDPFLTWSSYEGLFRSYVINCKLSYVVTKDQALGFLEDKKRLKWLASYNECDLTLPAPSDKATSAETTEYLKIVNNFFVCNSKPVVPGLFEFRQNLLVK